MKNEGLKKKMTSWIRRNFSPFRPGYFAICALSACAFVAIIYKFFLSLNHTQEHSMQYAIASSTVMLLVLIIYAVLRKI